VATHFPEALIRVSAQRSTSYRKPISRQTLRELIEYSQTWPAFRLSLQDPRAVAAVEGAAALAEIGADTRLTVRMPLAIVAGRKPG
jgi:hypothetical protein